MKIAVVLSGTIRFHHKSVATIALLRVSGHDVDVYLHCWNDIERFVGDSWSWHFPPSNPTDEILSQYASVKSSIESWPEARAEIVEQVEWWKRWNPLKFFTHYGMPGMWRSLCRAYRLIEDPAQYDVVVRLRFDGGIGGDLPIVGTGWHIPDAVDFGGYSDQLAWYRTGRENDKQNLDAYFLTYENLTRWFEVGTLFAPEVLLKKSLDSLCDHPPHRPQLKFSIHSDPV